MELSPAGWAIEYQPALDGLRAVAVAMVLVFHADLGVLSGGYVGVSVFFTLSGFLITRLLHQEVASTGRVDVRAFLSRRARRLLPASALCLVGVAVAARAGLLDGVTHLQRDLLGSALQVQNWVLLFSGESYTDLLLRGVGRPSPLEHYWSLAIEEQFYWLWPAAFVGIAVVARRRLTDAVGVLALVLALAAPLIAVTWGSDAAYWASPARLAEIVIGAWLALSLPRIASLPARRWWAPAGLAAIVVAAAVAAADSAFLYGGGFPLFALASALLIAGLEFPGAVTTGLAARPVAAVGRVSYGLYLFHWPVYVSLDEPRTGIGGVGLFAVRLLVTTGITVTSYHVLERPIRRARWSPATTLATATAAMAVVIAASVALPPRFDDQYWLSSPAADVAVDAIDDDEPLDVVGRLAPPGTNVAGSTTAPTPSIAAAETTLPDDRAASTDSTVPAALPVAAEPLPTPSRPVRIMLVGDSTAMATGTGMSAWAADHPELATVQVVGHPGFGFLQSGRVVDDADDRFSRPAALLLREELPDALARFRPDVVLAMVTIRDLEARRWDDDEGTLDPLDPRFVGRLADAYTAATRLLLDSGAHVAWVRPIPVDPFWLGIDGPGGDSPQRDVYEQVVAEVVGGFDDGVTLVDLREHAERTGLAVDVDARPDGLHWTPEASAELSASWLGPELVRLALPSG